MNHNAFPRLPYASPYSLPCIVTACIGLFPLLFRSVNNITMSGTSDSGFSVAAAARPYVCGGTAAMFAASCVRLALLQ